MIRRSPPVSPLLVLLLAAIAAPAGAIDLLPRIFGGDDGRSVWKGDDQYVRLVPRGENPGGRTPPNDHPVRLEPETLKKVLESIVLWREGGFFDLAGEEETVALFTTSQASLLGRKLAEALAEARADEDVTFAVRGLKSKLMVGKDHFYTAGRVFYQGGRLNLIVGDLHRTYEYGKEKDISGIEQGVDRRRYPHRPGEREKARSHEARLMNTAGMTFFDAGGELRGDWLVIDLAQALAAAEQRAVPEEIARETQKVKEEAAKLAIERRQMREEMARLRKQVEDMQGGAGSAEDRLARLEALRSKALISDEEYRAKRQAILDEI